jgi:hypothetical protein
VVDYATVAGFYLSPLAEAVTAPSCGTAPARRLRDAVEAIATQGWWARDVHERLVTCGLEDFLAGYVWGRAASLGDGAPADLVAATFGVFEPSLLEGVYDAARAVVSRADVLAARAGGASAALARILRGAAVADAEVGHAADALLGATAGIDATARPLFAALRALPLPDDPHGRLWRGAELVREHRGDGHLAACIAAGLDPVEMNVLTELWVGYPVGAYSGTRGYDGAAIDAALGRLAARGWTSGAALTPAGRAARDAIEAATDASQFALVEELDDRLDGLVTTLSHWSALVVAAGSAPTDPRKAAAG